MTEELLENPEAVYLAAWYHDLVYVVGRNDNEILSELEAKRVLEVLGCSEAFKKKVFGLIQATVYIGKDCIPDNKLTNDQKYLRDADYSIMGDPWKEFCAYEMGIRREYESVVSTADYVKGRIAFLRGVLQKPLIFYTEFCQDRCEAQARRNIQRAIVNLSK